MNSEIKSIELIAETSSDYKLFQMRYKNEKPKDKVLSIGNRKISDIMGYLLELSIKHWVSKSKYHLKNNILKFEVIEKKRINTLYKELDFITQKGNAITIGEVKSTAVKNGNVNSAFNQLVVAKNLLKAKYKSIQMQVIWVDVYYKYTSEPIDMFNENFEEVKFRTIEQNGNNCQVLHLSAEDVFRYGIKEKVILSEELFYELNEEMDALHIVRKLKEELKHNLKLNNATEKLNENLRLADAKLKLVQDGWVLIDKDQEQQFKELLTSNNNPATKILDINDSVNKSNKFVSRDKLIKYIFFKADNDSKISLLSSNAVYMKVPLEISKLAESVMYNNPDMLFPYSKNSYPFISRNPCRQFFVSGEISSSTDKSNEAFHIIEQVIMNSEGQEVSFDSNKILIVDNHKMLYR